MSGGETSYPILADTGIQSPQSIYELSTTQHHPIGTPARLIGGRVFYYARHSANATTAAGKLHVAATPLTAFEDLAVGTLSLGSQTITGIVATSTIASSNAFQYLCVVDGGGEGQMFRLRSHGTGTGSPTITARIFGEPGVALTASSQVSLLKDIYADVVVAVTDSADRVAGIAQVAMVDSSSTARYVWLQTYGPCPAWVEGTPAEGAALVNDDTTAGNLAAASTTVGAVTIVGTHTSNATKISTTVTPTATTTAGRVVAYQLGVDGTTNEVQMVDLVIRAC